MTDTQKRIIRALQNGLPVTQDPFGEIARDVGISRDELLSQMRAWKSDGTIRRLGAILRHHRAGYSTNAMAVWKVPDEQVEAFGRTASGFDCISHCYQRPRFAEFGYNLYTMIHGKSSTDCESAARELSECTRIFDYALLYTIAEYKKSSPIYFANEENT
ncbi:MAG: siroheme decarboxylase subunit beta [Armatimonadota bacterium]